LEETKGRKLEYCGEGMQREGGIFLDRVIQVRPEVSHSDAKKNYEIEETGGRKHVYRRVRKRGEEEVKERARFK